MSIKKILAAAVASVMAVSAMAVTAFAADGSADIPDANAADRQVEFKNAAFDSDFVGSVNPEDIESITFKADGDFTLGYHQAGDAAWIAMDNDDVIKAGTEYTLEASKLNFDTSMDRCVKFCAYYTGSADNYPDPITVEWTFNLKAGEAAANEEAPATEAAAEAPAAENAAAANTAPADKGNADTGVEGVAVVASLAVLAAGAIVVAKKRK
ncbi:MAG: hypothetical protein NC228_11020 [[Eubacterium] siraeum]|nr:hypothetical protein [[Eubacterium] siraeum]